MYTKIPPTKAPTPEDFNMNNDDLYTFAQRMMTLLNDGTKAENAGINNVMSYRPVMDGLLATYAITSQNRYFRLDEYNTAKQALEPSKFAFESCEKEFLDLREQIAIVLKKALANSTMYAADAPELERRLNVLETETGWEGGKLTFNIPCPVSELTLVKNMARLEIAWKIPEFQTWSTGRSGEATSYEIEIDNVLAAVTPYTMKWITAAGSFGTPGEHTINVYAVNDAGRSSASHVTYTI